MKKIMKKNMKKIQKVRLATQVLFAGLTITAIAMDLPVLKILILLTTILGGIFYCGWACSFGFIQDMASKLGRKLGIKQRQLPESVHKVAVYMRYILAVLTMALATEFVMDLMQFEARGAFLALISGRIPTMGVLVVIGFFMILSMKYDRVYCRYICPEGARYGILSLVRPFTLKRNENTCIGCGKCDRACPMQIKISKSEKLRSPQCVNCFECVSSCPVDGALDYGYVFSKNRSMETDEKTKKEHIS